jgi:hypothetical protein
MESSVDIANAADAADERRTAWVSVTEWVDVYLGISRLRSGNYSATMRRGDSERVIAELTPAQVRAFHEQLGALIAP